MRRHLVVCQRGRTIHGLGGSLNALASRYLWSDIAPDLIAKFWRDRRSAVPSDAGCDMWAKWYEACFAGRPFAKKTHLAYVMASNGIWEEGPGAVDAWIVERLATPDES